MISREYDGLAGAGGVKDVCRQLSETLVAEAGVRVTVVLPRYGFMDAGELGFSPLALPETSARRCGERRDSFTVEMNYPDEERRELVSLWEHELRGVRVLLVEAERFAKKLGVYTYTEDEERRHSWQRRGSGHYDYFAMNILLQKAAMAAAVLLGERPDIFHCHDGHAATLAAMIRETPGYRHYFRDCGVVVTVHNAGLGYHQEVGDLAFARAVTGLPERCIARGCLNDAFDPFLVAADYALLNTVSENYARELQETADDARTGWLGHCLRRRGIELAGVTNGISPRDFDPARPRQHALAAPFSPGKGDLAGKRRCKEALLAACGAGRFADEVVQTGSLDADPGLPLLTFIGRLTAQKGVDVLVTALETLLRDHREVQVLILGSGERELERQLEGLAGSGGFPGRFCYLKGYAPRLALQVYAAGDFFLIPSLYEPCGLTDYIAQLLGNLPVVHGVGGLVKVEDGRTGFSYREHHPAALLASVERALTLFRDSPETLRRMQREAVVRIESRYTWKAVMRHYFSLYDRALALSCGARRDGA